jgi:hypothetical protein
MLARYLFLHFHYKRFLRVARGEHGAVIDNIGTVANAQGFPDIMVRDQYPNITLP